MKEIVKFKNILDETLFLSLNDELTKYARWELNNCTNTEEFPNDLAWNLERHEYGSTVFYKAATIIKLKVLKYIKKDIRLVRIYSNGQTCHQRSHFHNDFDPEYYYTFIFFSNLHWDANWGGNFICYNPNTETYDYTHYVPNCGVLIPAHWQHIGNSPNVNTQEFRTTLAFSFIETDSLKDCVFDKELIRFK